MEHPPLLPHLFRTEFSRISAVLTRLLGVEHLEAAEDIASETFLLALETWPYQGTPDNPTAWLYTVAKNKARNYFHRHQIFTQKIADQLYGESDRSTEPEIDLSESNITDSQLQMLFAVCHPSIPREAQVGLALRTLCGFGIDEIATAFLTSKDTINKRLYRAREKLRQEQVRIELPSEAEIDQRLDAVLTTLYLLFSEGYYSESHDAVLREDLCLEAMRLCYLLRENERTNQPAVNALLALMCFHASRFPARRSAARRAQNGELVLYHEQDETLWNQELITRGAGYLQQAARGSCLTKYHLEASIAYWHTIRADTPEKWETILQLYNRLLQLEYSPIAALNRTYALAKANGKAEAIRAAEKLQLNDTPYYHSLLGELYQEIDNGKARKHLEKALKLARSQADKQMILKKLATFG